MNRKTNKKIWTLILFGISVLSVYAGDFDRGIKQHTFVPKGQWIVGSSISYSQYDDKNYKFLVIDGFDASGYSFKISPVLCYAFKDNLAAGGRAMYQRTLAKIDRLDIGINDDMNINTKDIYKLSHSYSGMAILRYYISLGSSARFGLFNEAQLSIGGSQSKYVNGKGESVSGTFSSSTDLQFGMAPGLVAFVNNYTTVEVSIGVLGLNYSKTRQTTDQIYNGDYSSSSANFKINLFSIGLGIALYL